MVVTRIIDKRLNLLQSFSLSFPVQHGIILTQQYMMMAVKVHYKFELMEETLYLTVNLIDRFLAVQSVVRKKLQLVGVTAMLIACKYEEVSVPVVDDLILISDKAYTRKEVLDMVSFLCSFANVM